MRYTNNNNKTEYKQFKKQMPLTQKVNEEIEKSEWKKSMQSHAMPCQEPWVPSRRKRETKWNLSLDGETQKH